MMKETRQRRMQLCRQLQMRIAAATEVSSALSGLCLLPSEFAAELLWRLRIERLSQERTAERRLQ